MKQHAWRLGENADWNTHTVLNAVPQRSKLNQGIWFDLEKKTGEWADRYGRIWIITGPIVYNNTPTRWLGQRGEIPVVIPDAFFKIVAQMEGETLRTLAFVYPQEVQKKKRGQKYNHTQYAVSVDDIEALTGLDFFPYLSDRVEVYVESRVEYNLW